MSRHISVFIFYFLLSCNASHHDIEPIIFKKDPALQISYHPFNNEKDLDILLKEIDTSRIVLLGEASHGTSEYYNWRAAISKLLIKEKGFSFIAVEGDWTDSYKVNNFIKAEKKDSNAVITLLKEYNRWPTWLWANYEVASLVGWLNEYNQNRSAKDKIGFYGLDLFNIAEAANDLKLYLRPADSTALQAVKSFQECFKPYANDEQKYSKDVSRQIANCKDIANHLLRMIHSLGFKPSQTEADLAIEQNAQVVFDGELYWRTRGNAVDAWNLRDNHMLETINRILKLYGNKSKAIIWAHNNHVGDVQYGKMIPGGKTSLGNMLRYQYGVKNVFIVGFGSYSGSIIAAEKWGAPYKKTQIAFADDSTWEQKMHQLNPVNKIIICTELKDNPIMLRWMYHMGIGVIYHPLDRTGIYSLSVIPNRYDAFLFFDHTNALHPIEKRVKGKEPLSY
ncbi:MAG TPA: erythromycin esterase family protein [Chitinophagaceae bacterium]|nr:erythromycin esterase family protein [Chitinophagaceae bacterium]